MKLGIWGGIYLFSQSAVLLFRHYLVFLTSMNFVLNFFQVFGVIGDIQNKPFPRLSYSQILNTKITTQAKQAV